MKKFLSEKVNDQAILDVVFEASQNARAAIKEHGSENVVNGVFGAYFKEEGGLLTFDTVYRTLDEVPDVEKARYAASISGAPEFKKGVKYWLFEKAGIEIDCDIIATPGGTGALSSTVKNTLAPGETVIHPEIGWGPYKTIAKQHNVGIETYKNFDGDRFNLEAFSAVCEKVMEEQGKVLVFINDPCQNPTGYTIEDEEWDAITDFLDTLSEKGPIVMLVDIAYIDFTHKGDDYKQTFKRFENMSDNVLTVLAFSASKTMTAYGMRVGAQVLIGSTEERRTLFKNACENTCRGTWSTVNNGGMMTFASLALEEDKRNAYMKEKEAYLELLKERAEIFTREAEEAGLPLYPYKEGFFITIRIDDADRKNALHMKLQEHNIFFVNVKNGLRVAICSIPKEKVKGLARRVKEIYDPST